MLAKVVAVLLANGTKIMENVDSRNMLDVEQSNVPPSAMLQG